MLICSNCKEILPPESFHQNARAKGRGYRAYICKECLRTVDDSPTAFLPPYTPDPKTFLANSNLEELLKTYSKTKKADDKPVHAFSQYYITQRETQEAAAFGKVTATSTLLSKPLRFKTLIDACAYFEASPAAVLTLLRQPFPDAEAVILVRDKINVLLPYELTKPHKNLELYMKSPPHIIKPPPRTIDLPAVLDMI